VARIRLWVRRVARAALMAGPCLAVPTLSAIVGLITASFVLSVIIPATAGSVSGRVAAVIVGGCVAVGVMAGALALRTVRPAAGHPTLNHPRWLRFVTGSGRSSEESCAGPP
jgi:hypothetical protein